MEQYDVYSSRMGLTDAAVSLQRNHAKLKRDKGDFTDEGIKIAAVKVPRQSLQSMDNVTLTNHSESGAMNVLPRLLRTMTNGSCQDSSPCSGAVNRQTMASASAETTTLMNGAENGTLAAAAAAAAAVGNPDTDSSSSSSSSSSSASSFISPPSSGSSSSSLISFLSPGGQLGSVAMAAAAVLSASTTSNSNTTATMSAPSTTSVHDAPESSGLVTLATASSLIEQEWLARAAFASSSNETNQNIGSASTVSCADNTTTMTTTSSPTGDLVTLTVEHGSDPGASASPPLLFKTLTSNQSPHPQINGTNTQATRTVLNLQGFAALIRETQKQCSSRSTPTTPLELPLNSVFSVSSTAGGTELSQTTPPCASDSRSRSPPCLTYSCAPTTMTESLSPQQGQSISGETLLITDSVTTDGNGAAVDSGTGGSQQPTAFISLQPAPGSILSSSDLQQLMTSGEFMSSAARQTLLGQSPDGSTRQLYLLVPSDCPVIMSRASTNQSGSTVLTSASSPLLNSTGATSAPILEAISPGVEPDDSCDQLPPTLSHSHLPTGVSTSQSVHVALPAQLAGAVLAPMRSATTTALSTLIAGLEVRGQSSQQARYTNPVQSNTSTAPATWSTTSERTTVHTTDSVIPNSPRVRLPLNIPGVTLSEHSQLLSTDQSIYTNASINGVSSLLGAIKSDPDMYTPNGHPYASLVEDVTRFRSYPTYTQSATHQQVPITSVRAVPGPSSSNAGTTNTVFFQPDLSASLLLPPPPQSTLVSTAVSGANTASAMDNTAAQVMVNVNTSSNTDGGHMIQTNSLSRVNATFAVSSSSSSGASSAASIAVASPSNGKTPNGPIDDCRRNMTGTLLTAAAAAAAAAAASTPTPTGSSRADSGPTTYLEHLNPESKDIRRRVSHNEVERRRRDRINTWISELYKLLPPDEQAKSQYQSKGVVLKRVCEYFQNVDSMLKAANAAVEQTRVENGLLRQRVSELEREKQFLSASLHIGAAAAAVHLQHRQPRQSASLLHSDESVNGNGMDTVASMKDSVDSATPGDYPAAVTVFTVGSNGDYTNNNTHTVTFTQSPVTVPLTTNTGASSVAASFNNNSSTIFNGNPNPTSSGSSSTAPAGSAAAATAMFVTTPTCSSGSVLNPNAGRPPPLTLPSLDLVANHSDTRTD